MLPSCEGLTDREVSIAILDNVADTLSVYITRVNDPMDMHYEKQYISQFIRGCIEAVKHRLDSFNFLNLRCALLRQYIRTISEKYWRSYILSRWLDDDPITKERAAAIKAILFEDFDKIRATL